MSPGGVDGRGRRFAARDFHRPGALSEPDRADLRRVARHRTRLHGHGRRSSQHPQDSGRSGAEGDHDRRAVRRDVRSADRDDAARPQRRSAGEIPLGKPGEPRLCARKGRTRPRREGQRDLWQPRHRVGHSQNVRRGDEGSEGLHAGHRNPTSSGRATNTRPPVRDSSSTPTPTKASSRSRKRRW